jgi:hypothetical protein
VAITGAGAECVVTGAVRCRFGGRACIDCHLDPPSVTEMGTFLISSPRISPRDDDGTK